MVEFYVLTAHASQALDINPAELDLPRCGYGIDADALWWDPRFVEIRRERMAVAAQMAERRVNIHAELSHKPRTEAAKEAMAARTRARRYARKKRQRQQREARAGVV